MSLLLSRLTPELAPSICNVARVAGVNPCGPVQVHAFIEPLGQSAPAGSPPSPHPQIRTVWSWEPVAMIPPSALKVSDDTSVLMPPSQTRRQSPVAASQMRTCVVVGGAGQVCAVGAKGHRKHPVAVRLVRMLRQLPRRRIPQPYRLTRCRCWPGCARPGLKAHRTTPGYRGPTSVLSGAPVAASHS